MASAKQHGRGEVIKNGSVARQRASEYRSTAVVEIKLMVVVVQPLLHRPLSSRQM